MLKDVASKIFFFNYKLKLRYQLSCRTKCMHCRPHVVPTVKK